MSPDAKVVPDTNVVVASSIIGNVGELGIIKHRFYEPSIQLFSLFRDPGIGVAVPRVRAECFGVLSRAVKSAYIPKNKGDRELKEKFYNELVAFVSSSEYKLRELLSRLTSVNLDRRQVSENLEAVRQMSKHLRELYRTKYRSPAAQRRESIERSKSVTTEPTWNPDQKSEAIRAYGDQVARESKQLERFMNNYPNESDQRILAEVITFKRSLAGESSYVLIASWDRGFFSPYHYRGGTSDIVTKEIYERFGIKCDDPKEVFRMAGGVA